MDSKLVQKTYSFIQKHLASKIVLKLMINLKMLVYLYFMLCLLLIKFKVLFIQVYKY